MNDAWISWMAKHTRMIDPFVGYNARELDGKPAISYGLSSFGYDIRLAPEFKVFTNIKSAVVDPKRFTEDCFIDESTDRCVIPPNSFALGRSIEHIKMPPNITGLAVGKSTYARAGIIVNVTPIESSWSGYITIEISNTTPLPCAVYANEGILQLLFLRGESPTTTYADRKGKYQDQVGITLPRV